MKSAYSVFLFLLLIIKLLPAQTQENGDCTSARTLRLSLDNRIIVVDSPATGFGMIQEIDAPRGNKYWFTEEHNTHWYRFVTPFTGMLSLELRPREKQDDYDFLLFIDSTGQVCEEIIHKYVSPIRSMISRNDTSIGGYTGLNAYAARTHQEEGPGDAYIKAVQVEKGQKFYLVIDNVYGGGKGYELEFFYYSLPRLFGKVIDAHSKEPIPAWVYVEKIETGELVDSIATDPATGSYDVLLPLEFKTDYKLTFFSEGYFMEFDEINSKLLKHLSEEPHSAALNKMEAGINLTLKNINFRPGVAEFISSAKPHLKRTLELMQRYPKLVVELEGHVNGVGIPDCVNHEHSNWLSWERAKAVRNYLIENGIEPDRMTVIGYGCTRMLFPAAKDEMELTQNRRVELKVISID